MTESYPKYINLKEFTDEGYLHEANRLFFHPLGLALTILVDKDGTYTLAGIQDFRLYPEGMSFYQVNKDKIDNIKAISDKRRPLREEFLGYWIQPIDDGTNEK